METYFEVTNSETAGADTENKYSSFLRGLTASLSEKAVLLVQEPMNLPIHLRLEALVETAVLGL